MMSRAAPRHPQVPTLNRVHERQSHEPPHENEQEQLHEHLRGQLRGQLRLQDHGGQSNPPQEHSHTLVVRPDPVPSGWHHDAETLDRRRWGHLETHLNTKPEYAGIVLHPALGFSAYSEEGPTLDDKMIYFWGDMPQPPHVQPGRPDHLREGYVIEFWENLQVKIWHPVSLKQFKEAFEAEHQRNTDPLFYLDCPEVDCIRLEAGSSKFKPRYLSE